MRYYNVKGVRFSFVHKHDTFFKDNFEKYEIEELKSEMMSEY